MKTERSNPTGSPCLRRALRGALTLGTLTALGTSLAFAAISEHQAQWLHGVKVLRETSISTTSSTSWVNVPGATTTLSLPANHQELIVARFTAESACHGVSGYCGVRILIDGVEMDPAVGTNFAFDSSDSGAESSGSWEGHAMERSRLLTGPCSGGPLVKQVTVQYRTNNPGITLWLDDWHLTVETLHAATFVC